LFHLFAYLIHELVTLFEFCLTNGENRGLGNVFIYVGRVGPHPPQYLTYPSKHAKFSDEDGSSSDGDLCTLSVRITAHNHSLSYLCLGSDSGLRKQNSHLLKSIEAFVTTILAHRSFEIEFLETQIVNFWGELYGKLTSARACRCSSLCWMREGYTGLGYRLWDPVNLLELREHGWLEQPTPAEKSGDKTRHKC